MRWGPGPVFIYECLANSRRWQTYALRSAGVAALLFAMGTIAMSWQATTAKSWRDYASLGESYFFAMIGAELAVVMLAAPAATAGAICSDRARGTLAHMLVTDLSDPEIVLGRLAARLLPVLGLVACTWPVMAISSLLGGIDPIALTLAIGIILAVAVFGCTLALAVSVWARKSHEVILATYTVFILSLLVWPTWFLLSPAGWVGPPPSWAALANPFYVAFAPYADPGKLGFWDYLVFFSATLGGSAFLTGLAVSRMRPVACRGSAGKSKRPRIGLFGRITRALPGPSLDDNPVLWREWHRSRPSRWMVATLALLMGTTGVVCIVGAAAYWRNGAAIGRLTSFWESAGDFAYLLHVIFGLLMLAAIAPTSMAEERQRGSLDILAATALSTRAIVIGKWLGTFRLVVPMAVGPGLMVLAMATARSPQMPRVPTGWTLTPPVPLGARIYGIVVVIATIFAHGALLTSVGLALAVWVKRQSRAIAMSVGWFLLVTAAWPFVVSITIEDAPRLYLGRDLASLSPVVNCNVLGNFLASRTNWDARFEGVLWSGAFWAVEVFVLAMVLLWLTVRTFDRCFGRLPDRPERIPTQTVAVLILAAMIGAGSLAAAFDSWIEGVEPGLLLGPSSLGNVAYSLVIAIGLMLVALVSARSGGLTWAALSPEVPRVFARRLVQGRWWESFFLVLLLAIGPAFLALALATARRAPHYEPQFTTNSGGVRFASSYVLARSDAPYVGEIWLGQRLMIAGVLIVTILVHGGAAVSVGLACSTSRGWRRRALATAAGLGLAAAMRGFVFGVPSLFYLLLTRTSTSVNETAWAVISLDAVVAFFAVALSWWTMWIGRRRLSGVSHATSSLAPGLDNGRPAVEIALISD